MKIVRILLLFLLLSLPAVEARSESSLPIDPESAKQWCDENPLDPIEGIWIYPSDKVIVLISKSGSLEFPYDITVLQSADNSLIPGETIGRVQLTADPKQFELSIFSSRKKGILSKPRKCAAKLLADDSGLQVASSKITWQFYPLSIIPGFWKMLRFRKSNPLDQLPVGMQKLYPQPNGGNRQTPFSKIYL